MTRKYSKRDEIAQRRTQVARLRLRGHTLMEIAKMLANGGIVNSANGKPYSFVTIKRDLDAMRADWIARANLDTDELTASVLAEVREARRQAWRDGDLTNVYKGLQQERDLLGLDAPKRLDVRKEIMVRARAMATELGLDVDDVLAEADRILAG